jgi:hypothetical protein
MFAITKLSKVSQDFINRLVSNNKSRSPEVSLAIAKVLTVQLPIPSSPVEDVCTYFKTTNQIEIEATLNSINELAIIDVNMILDYCLKFFMVRYNLAYPSKHVLVFNTDTAVIDFFGISRYIDPATLALIGAECVGLTESVNRFNQLIEELKAE